MPDEAPHSPVLDDPAVLSRLAGLELRARTIVEGHLAGLHRSPRQGFSVEFAEHRDYTPGDDLRYVDWKVYGKRDRYYLKQFEEETNFACHLLVDASESMAYRSASAPLSKWDYACCIAAALSWLVLQQQDAVGVALFDREVRETLRPSGQASQFKQIVSLLEREQPRGPSDVGAALHLLAERIPRRGLVLVISDLFGDPADIRKGLKHLGFRGHDVGVLQVIDPQEQDFAFDEPTEFSGLEAEGNEAVEPKSLRKAYLAAFEAFLAATAGACRELQAAHQLLRTDTPPGEALLRFLAARSRSRKI